MKRQGKSCELCSLSAKMTTSFLSRYERFAFIGWQESMLDSRDGVKHAVLQGVKRNILLYKGKNAKALQMESMLLYAIFLLYMKKPCATSTPCAPRSTPTWPFDVKPPTYEPIGLIPTRESSVLFEIILHQALK